MRAVLAGALLLTSCAAPSSTATTPTPAIAPTESPSATPAMTPSISAAPALTFGVDANAQWPVLVYEAEGAIIRERSESAVKEIARSCTQPLRLEARPAGLLEWCATSRADSGELRLVIADGGVLTLATGAVIPSWPADVSPDGRSVAAFRWGDCPTPAPVCQTRAVLVDVASKSERELLPSGYHLGATLEWTALGLTLFQPECAEAGCSGTGDKGGTFVWDGSAFKRWSDLRFVASAGGWTLLERLRSFSDQSDQRAVVIRGPRGDQTLSAGHALAISAAGEALVWAPGPGQLMRFAPDGRVLWQATLSGTVMKTIGTDALLVSSPTNQIEIYDLKRMLRFAPTTPISYVVAAAPR